MRPRAWLLGVLFGVAVWWILILAGMCVVRAVRAAPECPPVVCPLDAGICPTGCACVRQAPGDSFGRCAPCSSE